jgi:hypothetical protein
LSSGRDCPAAAVGTGSETGGETGAGVLGAIGLVMTGSGAEALDVEAGIAEEAGAADG